MKQPLKLIAGTLVDAKKHHQRVGVACVQPATDIAIWPHGVQPICNQNHAVAKISTNRPSIT
ncbi:hypothetical protein [Williamsia sp. 1138]|uniref:hypothetical protein n=1 Tax=Williamsia sp. 1138 TaxID=1903117 RepID=UPI00117F4A68|nr:hypothetical protein [Williamsia sp. 1138]